MPRIFIDAGHGGKDFGAIGNDLHEKDVVLDIARGLQKVYWFIKIPKFY